MKSNRVIVLACAIAATFSAQALADESEKETPAEEQAAKQGETPMPEGVKAWINYLVDLERRYPDSAAVDVDKFMDEEGQTAALAYCQAIGVKGPCVPADDGSSGQPIALAVSERGANAGRWWDWLWNRLFSIGVIPEWNKCPVGSPLVTIHMDDEDRRNANYRWGWIGSTTSNSNTTWRYCKLDNVTSIGFRPLKQIGQQYDYSVQKLGLFCPSGARTVVRRHDNEDWSNANGSSGSVFPNVNFLSNWVVFTCHFDGGAPSILGHMPAFPTIGTAYGVYAPQSMPSSYALAHGYVYQDDEDFLNLNFWIGSGDWVMGGSNNTWRYLAKVR